MRPTRRSSVRRSRINHGTKENGLDEAAHAVPTVPGRSPFGPGRITESELGHDLPPREGRCPRIASLGHRSTPEHATTQSSHDAHEARASPAPASDRHPIGALVFALVLFAGYSYRNAAISSRPTTPYRCASVCRGAEGGGLHHGGAGDRQLCTSSLQRDASHRRTRLPYRSRSGSGGASAQASGEYDAQVAVQRAQINANQAQAGASESVFARQQAARYQGSRRKVPHVDRPAICISIASAGSGAQDRASDRSGVAQRQVERGRATPKRGYSGRPRPSAIRRN